jgi:hypothetical protein
MYGTVAMYVGFDVFKKKKNHFAETWRKQKINVIRLTDK